MELGPKVPARGNLRAKIMLVGEAPGAREEQLGQPFVGPAGNVLTEILLKAGIDPDDCYFTNLCKYRPPGNDLAKWIPGGVPLDPVTEGLDELAEEIKLVNPNVIVPLGNWPLWAFYSRRLNKEGEAFGIKSYRGYILEARKLAAGRKLVPTLHPSYLLRGAYAEIPLATFDLERAKDQSSSPAIHRRARQLIIDPRGEERDRVRDRLLNEGRWLCVDIEYIGSRLLCVGFAVSSDWACTIRIRSPEDVSFCRSLLESGRPLLMQNAMFDCGILEWHYQMETFKNLSFDTMVAAYNLNIEYPKDLGFLAGLYTDLHPWWEVTEGDYWKQVKNGNRDIEELLPYNCYDAISTYEIAEKQDPELDTDPKLRAAFQFDMRKIPELWKVAVTGIRLDTAKISSIRNQAIHDADEAQTLLNDIAEAYGMELPYDKELGCRNLNVKSAPQIIEFLFGWLMIQPGGKTPGKQLRTDNKTLMECMRKETDTTKRKALELVLTVRLARDIQSKFTEIDWDEDERARTIYDPTKTDTRRLSAKKFFPTGKGTNLQNIAAPGSNKYGADVRQVFIADPGYEFGYADLKGAEFLIVADETQDPLMLKYAEMTRLGTGDVHRETAAFVFGRIEKRTIDPNEIGKESPQRFLGKKTRHSANYMVGPKEFMENINKEALQTGVWLDMKLAKLLINTYAYEMHPGLPAWWDWIREDVRRHKMIRNLFGHIRRFNSNINEALPAAVAFRPQSTVGDAANMGLLACAYDEELRYYKFQLLLQAHDAIGYQYPLGNRYEVNSRVRKLMDIPIPSRHGGMISIPVEIQCGPSWGQGTVYKGDLNG